jgi:hypothetical protein
LDTNFSADAFGGPEFSTAIINAGEGGSISFRNSNREDYISRYEIDFDEVSPARRKALRTFSILRERMARGFRFLAPDDDELESEHVGKLNTTTGEVEFIGAVDGVLTEFYLIKHLSDQGNNYTRRIIKPSPFDDFHVDFYNPSDTLVETITLAANSGLGAFATILETNGTTGIVDGIGLVDVTLYQWTGKVVIGVTNVIPANWKIRVRCVYHVPVTFEDDWQRFKVDDGGISSFRVRLRELLPVELGIT